MLVSQSCTSATLRTPPPPFRIAFPAASIRAALKLGKRFFICIRHLQFPSVYPRDNMTSIFCGPFFDKNYKK